MTIQRLARGFIQLVLFLTLLALAVIVLYFFAAYMQTQPLDIHDRFSIWFSFAMAVLLLLAPSAYFLFNLSILKKFRRSKVIFPKIFSKEIKWVNSVLLVTMLVFNTLLVSVVSFLAFMIFTEKPPQFFRFDDPKATYTIEKERYTRSRDLYYVHYVTTSEVNKSYVCTADGLGNESCDWEYNRNVQTLVSESPVDLAQFVGEEVILDGEFVRADEQCIIDECVDTFGPVIGIDIKEIQLK